MSVRFIHQHILMRSYQILVFAFLTYLCFTVNLQAQSDQNNLVIVKRVYESLEKNDNSSLTDELLFLMKDQNSEMAYETTSRHKISLLAILENRWEKISINNFQLEELNENKILVTGEFLGRQLTECEFVITEFRHEWWLKDGNIIKLTEESNSQNHAITKN